MVKCLFFFYICDFFKNIHQYWHFIDIFIHVTMKLRHRHIHEHGKKERKWEGWAWSKRATSIQMWLENFTCHSMWFWSCMYVCKCVSSPPLRVWWLTTHSNQLMSKTWSVWFMFYVFQIPWKNRLKRGFFFSSYI